MKYNLNKLLLAIVGLLLSTTALAHSFEVDGIYYDFLDHSAKTVAVTYKGSYYDSYTNEYTGSVTIPSSVTYNGTTYSVTEIGLYAFRNCTGLTSVTIPNSVTDIGYYAFEECNGLTSVTIPNSVTSIGSDAFYNCTGLTSVTIPNSVTKIGSSAFSGTAWYNNQPDGVIYINNVLYKYKGTMPEGTSISIKDGTVSISPIAFYDCTGLTSITIPNSVTSIGYEAFYDCSGLTEVTIPNSVTSIGTSAFYGCTGLTEVNISDLSAWCKIRFGSAYANPIYYAKKFKLNENEIKDLVIPNDITQIKDYAFSGCTGLKSVTIGNSVTSIGTSAFYGCTGLTELTIVNSVTSIGSFAFLDCTGLTEVNYNAENCTSMGSSDYPVFKGCSNLKTLNIGNEVKNIPSYAFLKCTGLTSVTIPNSVTKIGTSAFSGCTGLTEVNYNAENCTSMGSSSFPVFSGCSNLKTLNIGNEVKNIPSYAFYNCDGLTEVTIGNSVTKIGSSAFYGTAWYNNQADGVIYINNVLYKYKGTMPEGTSISIKDGTVSISPYAFYDCTGLTEVTIPNSVTTIGYSAFAFSSGLTSITIPNSVTEIGDYAFRNCSNLKFVINLSNLTFSRGDSNYGYVAYYADRVINAPNGSIVDDFVFTKTDDTNRLAGYLGNATDLILPTDFNGENYTIGDEAFYNYSSLKSVTIPNSVSEIGERAFSNCGIRLIMSHSATPPTCSEGTFEGSYTALLMIPEGSLIDYALADEWHNFTQVHEVSEAKVSTEEKSATFEIPTIEGATQYLASVYSDASMSQLVATTHYDAYGKIIPMSTSLELSIDGFDNGVYYYKVLVKSAKGEILKNYIGTFEIDAAGIGNIATDDAVEVSRYDIHGRLLNEPTRGINIVIYSDGTTRKEIVK